MFADILSMNFVLKELFFTLIDYISKDVFRCQCNKRRFKQKSSISLSSYNMLVKFNGIPSIVEEEKWKVITLMTF